jgi:cytoskeletal protein CcmA (bactofilin family)
VGFAPTQQDKGAKEGSYMTKQSEGITVIGRGAKLRGDLTCAEDLLIEGEVDGTLRLTGGRLTIGPEAHVRASVGGHDVIIYGRLDGDVRATGRLELRAGAAVVGELFAARLSIEDNATVKAQVDPTRVSEALRPAPASAARPPVAAHSSQPASGTPGAPGGAGPASGTQAAAGKPAGNAGPVPPKAAPEPPKS